MTGTAFDKSNRKFINQEVVVDMPVGISEPADNELIIQAPTDVDSGTIYLDRLLVAASKVPQLKSNRERAADGLSGLKSGVGVTRGITPEPQRFLDLVPKSLTPEQQEYITQLRDNYFNVKSSTLEIDSSKYKGTVNKAKELLEAYCVKLSDGSYRFKNKINFAGIGSVMFKGEFYIYRKFRHHLPKGMTHLDHVGNRSNEIFKLFLAAPDNEYCKALFKAYIAWEKTYIYDSDYVPAPGGKYGYNAANARKIISVIKDNPEFEVEREYISRLPLSGDAKHYGVFYQKRDPYWSLEFPHAGKVFDNMLYEPDDRRLYAMLQNYRDSLRWFYAISTPGRAGIIKPDYTFFHHGSLIYWGVTNLPWGAAPHYLNSPLDFDPSIHKTWANHIGRWHYFHRVQGLAAGQVANWYRLTPKPRTPEYPLSGDPKPELTPQDVIHAANSKHIIQSPTFVEYIHDMDWEKIPAAKKFMAGMLGRGYSYHGQLVVDELRRRYPKTESVEPQTSIHMSANYTGWTSYTYDNTTAFVRGNSKTASNFGEGGTRQYGMLMLVGRQVDKPLGANQSGYSMLEIPGTTMPSLTEVEWNDEKYSFVIPSKSGNPQHLPIKRVDGVGAVTFNETDETFGIAGNHSIVIEEAGNEKWSQLGVKDFVGKKSYHFFQDKVVALGSDYQAKTKRPMKTVLIQDLVDQDTWNLRDYRRWNTEKPILTVNGKTYSDDVSLSFDLSKPNYFINPYGHAWIIPAGQSGKLKFDWKERKTTLVSRFKLVGGGFNKPGEFTYQTQGKGVIGRIEQNSNKPSTHHYCILLNSERRSLKELDKYARETYQNMGYKVLKQDKDAHAVLFEGENKRHLYSYVIYKANADLDLPLISSTNRRMNVMMQKNEDGNFVISIADPEINFDKANDIKNPSDKFHKEDPRNIRTIRVRFKQPISILEARSGLPESNPDLNAKIEGENVLTFQTRDGVSDTFVVKLKK